MKSITHKQCDKLGESLGYFKLNLPSVFEDFQTNNGEGIWAVVKTKAIKEKLDGNEEISEFTAYACNDSVYYPQIKCGDPIIAMSRGGDLRPIAIWDHLNNPKQAERNRKRIMKVLLERDEQ